MKCDTTPKAALPKPRPRSSPVPLGIWLCAPTAEDEAGLPPLVHGLSRALVARVAEEFSRPANTVMATGLDAARVAAVMAARAGRRLPTQTASPVTVGHRERGSGRRPPDGSVGLILAVELPVPFVDDDGQPYLTWARWLRPGGVLAVVTANPAGVDDFAHHTAAVVRAAETAGLSYLQHIVAVLAHVEGDRLLVADPPPLSAEAHRTVHVPAHSDLLIFTAPGSAASSPAPTGTPPDPINRASAATETERR